MPGHGFEKVSFERADVVLQDAMFDSFDSTPHPTGHHHDPSDETIVGFNLWSPDAFSHPDIFQGAGVVLD